MKFHFATSVLFAVALALMALNNSLFDRMLFLVPVLILFYASILLFGVEYEKERSRAWKNKEKNIVEETYSKFVKTYYSKKKK